MGNRKDDHINLCLNKDVDHRLSSGFEKYRFKHNALPEIDLSEIDTRCTFLGKKLKAPFLISAMTGGTELARKININLAKAAQDLGIAMCLGSMRIAIENPRVLRTFQLRDHAPDIALLSNLGAVQLNYGYVLRECSEVVELVHADGLVLHLNPLQEAIQPEGNTNFKGLARKIALIKKRLPYPMIVKEVGSGISYDTALKLKGIDYIDTAGAGGTSFAAVEGFRGEQEIAETFRDWGIPTSESIKACVKAGHKVIASGGIRSGLDAAKSIALGAALVGIAKPLLEPATISSEKVVETMKRYIQELKISMFCIGAKNLKSLKNSSLIRL